MAQYRKPRAAANVNPMMPPAGRAAQAKVEGLSVGSRYACSRCGIYYAVGPGDKAECPLCALEKNYSILEMKLQEAVEKARGLDRTVASLQSQVDYVNAMRQSMSLIDTRDRTFLKSFLYRYRADRGIALIAMHPPGTRTRDARKPRTAFRVEERNVGEDGELHICSSVGGLALVGYFHEASCELGQKQALTYLLRAVSLEMSEGK